jgi:hypothetical protein
MLAAGLAAASATLSAGASAQARVPHTPDGRPDLQGNWTNATLTPFERPRGYGPIFTAAQVDSVEGREEARVQRGSQPSDVDRAPPQAGNVGGYNEVYFDRGDRVAVVDGAPRTSLITFPDDGRMPALSTEGLRRQEAFQASRAAFGDYDHPELRPLAERCIVYYGSSTTGVMGVPMTPTSGYNNNFTIVQTPDHVVISSEMIHDIRIVNLGEPERLPAHIRPWFGDSWGRWEGNTLVVETTNVHPEQGIRDSANKILHSENLRLLERFTLVDENTILYEFTVDDPDTYSEVWGGQIPWRRFDQQIFEYGCHEGNYALDGILRGGRYQDSQGR